MRTEFTIGRTTIHVCWSRRAAHRAILWHGMLPVYRSSRKIRLYSVGWLFITIIPKGH